MIAPTDVSQMSQLQIDEYEYNTGMCLYGLIYPGFMNNVIRLYIPPSHWLIPTYLKSQ
jgi:hypothetical protein